MEIENLGLTAYDAALRLQEQTLESVSQGLSPEKIFLLEHPHVFTVGRGRRRAGLSDSQPESSIPTFVVSRGGDITYHGPGQLVGYPILDLRRRARDVHAYLRNLEECLLRTVSEFGLTSYRRKGLSGLWTDEGKLASIGVRVRRWTTMHGFALNVAPELSYFSMIDACGIADCPVTSMSELLGRAVSIREVEPVIARQLVHVLSPADSSRSKASNISRNPGSGPGKPSHRPA